MRDTDTGDLNDVASRRLAEKAAAESGILGEEAKKAFPEKTADDPTDVAVRVFRGDAGPGDIVEHRAVPETLENDTI
ncbi:hypothetical protein N9Z27_00130 [Alphaproteobacteria bacterium]|nr:hypothetical protein [Alphaproteobacteria bacterium]